MKKILLSLLTLFWSTSTLADLIITDCTESWSQKDDTCYLLHGRITNQDVMQIKRISPLHVLYLNNIGGGVYDAMEIGRHISETDTTAIVRGDCLSACVFVLAGATNRYVYGRVGIHRPYNTFTGNIDRKEAQQRYTKLQNDAQNYFREMNIPDTLYDAMVVVLPQDMKILTENELWYFLLNRTDPVASEIYSAKQAAKYGITIDKYLFRMSQIMQQCSNSDGSLKAKCYDQIMSGK